MSGAPRTLVLASAGSGKTYRVSSVVIGLLALDEAPDTVFASTFTRKAAGEILDRVLVRLASASLRDDAAAELAADTSSVMGAQISLDAEGWRRVLRTTVDALHRLDIGTLDAFFLQILRAFGNDVGLPPVWGIVDEMTDLSLRADALERVLSDLDAADRLELLRGIAGGDASRSVHDRLMRLLGSLTALHRTIDPNAPGWRALPDRYPEGAMPSREEMEELARLVEGIEVPLTKAGKPRSLWEKALGGIADAIRSEDPCSVTGQTLFVRALSGAQQLYDRSPIGSDVTAVLGRVATVLGRIAGIALARRAKALGHLADLFTEALDATILDTGTLRFEDVPRLLGGPAAPGARSDLAYRTDHGIRHILLDEFQDTSLHQWTALRPIVDAVGARSDDGALVVVADPKQSIYGWRGAAPVVVHAVGERYSLPSEGLTKSWRSSGVVLDSVNQVFNALPGADVFDADHGDVDTAEDWVRYFEPHLPQDPGKSGSVRLLAGPEAPKGKSTALVEIAAEETARLHRAAPTCSIGVLTRTNQAVASIIFQLRRLGIPASEEGGTSLTDSGAVTSVLALLRMADHPGDGVSRYHVAHTALGKAVGFQDPADLMLARDVALRLRGALMDRGFGRTLARIVGRIEPSCSTRERRRLRQLVDLGYRWDASRPSDRISDFVRTVESERVESPEAGQVRVMTIHGAKGLEFDAVVLPELHASWFPAWRRGPVAYRPDPVNRATHAFPYVKREERFLFGDYEELIAAHRQARADTLRDALGTLYVGMTRARHALVMIVPSLGEKESMKGQSSARLLRERLAPGTDRAQPEQAGDTLHECGDSRWTKLFQVGPEPEELPRAPTDSSTVPGKDRVVLRSEGPRTRRLARARPSGLGTPIDHASPEPRVGADRYGRLRGTLVHAWLETLRWIEDWDPDAETLRAIADRVAPQLPLDRRDREAEWLRDRLNVPAIRSALSRGSFPDGSTVEVELPFLRRIGDALMEGFIDRVVLHHRDGRVIGAEVLDYKSDRLGGADTAEWEAEKARAYGAQLGAYRSAVCELYGLHATEVETRLVLLDTGSVVTTPPPKTT